MKLALRALLLSFTILTVMFACKKADEGGAPGGSSTVDPTPVADSNLVVSSISASGFTVTWPAATDDATAAVDLQYKLVYSLTNNLDTAANAEANGIVAMNWTANALTNTISSLSNSTIYYFAVLVKDADGNIGFAGNSATTYCTGKRIFLATANNGNLGGKTGADSICNSQKPGGMGTVKAMLSDNSGIDPVTGLPSTLNGRQACHGNCNSSNLYVIDWVIAAGQRYCTTDHSLRVGDGAATYPVLIVPVGNVLSSSQVNLYMGFNIQTANSTSNNCSNWTSASSLSSYVAGSTAGVYNGTNSSSFVASGTFPGCDTPASIVCVEQ